METKTKNTLIPWHSLEIEETLSRLGANGDTGLAEHKAAVRLETKGKNVLPRGKKTTGPQIILRQFASPLVYILLVAAVLTFIIKEYVDMIVILLVVGVNAAIGFFQEYRANKIFEKLKAIVKVEALVIRDGKLRSIDSENLVAGDLIVLKSGSKVPADARLLTASNLQANEAILTGESKPVKKIPGKLPRKALIGDRTNMVFMGTVLEQGEGRAIVVSTGAATEIGQITALTQSTEDEESPLQLRMKKLGSFLTLLFLTVSAMIFFVGLFRDHSIVEMIKTTIAVAVAAIPEGLPAAISVILAVSSQRILERKGLVRRLIAAETLGSTSVIASDKTGTLTHGIMKAEKIFAADKKRMLLSMALANEAIIEETADGPAVKGEATDKAKLEKYLESGTDINLVQQGLPRIALLPFDPERGYIASFHHLEDGVQVFVSGAPERILELSKLPQKKKEELREIYEGLAGQGYRMIAQAERLLKTKTLPADDLDFLADQIKNLEYLGLAAIRDPIRDDVRETLKITRLAGIKVMMITGDHILTAKAIGEELDFGTNDGQIITGRELDQMSDIELKRRVDKIEVIARATPVHKMRVIDAWQKHGAVVAMTGDGINDAPALKSADIGVAVGSGTDVSKEASDLILLDDSFSTITEAVQQGRTGFANIRKATLVVMSNAFTELILIGSSLAFGVPFPITAVQILWVNLVTDSLPVLSLAFEPSEKSIMRSKPTPVNSPILDRESKTIILAVSAIGDVLLVGIFFYLLKILQWDIINIQSFIFVATAVPTLINIFAFKSLYLPLTQINLLNNRLLLISSIIGFALMAIAIYLPALNGFLKTVPLGMNALLAIAAFAALKLALVEIVKWWFRTRSRMSF